VATSQNGKGYFAGIVTDLLETKFKEDKRTIADRLKTSPAFYPVRATFSGFRFAGKRLAARRLAQ